MFLYNPSNPLSKIDSLNQLLDIFWKDYITLNPRALLIYEQFAKLGETLSNDHLAFRTYDHPKVNLSVMEKIFLKFGYCEMGDYHFVEKKLYAKHYEHPNAENPKIFISQIKLNELSTFARTTSLEAINEISQAQLSHELLINMGRPWKAKYEIYEKLKGESEYAAWLYAFGFRVNHFTILINSLKTLSNLKAVNDFVKSNGHTLNSSGGEIKGTPEELLEQSSTIASNFSVPFSEGQFSIPSTYYEFAMRYSQANGQLYTGFIAKSADKIFESTNKGE